MPKKNFLICLSIFVLSVSFYSFSLGEHGPEYRDDEVFYFQSTKQIVETNDWLSPKYFEEHRWQKPILYYWLIGVSYKIFGINWFAARLPSAIMAGLALVVTWLMAKMLFSRRIAYFSTGILLTMPLFWRHAKNAVPDMSMNFFIIFAVYSAIRLFQNPEKKKYSTLFFISCALGFMIKGYMGLIAPLATIFIYALWTKNIAFIRSFQWGRGIGILIVIILPWFLYMTSRHGAEYINYMLGTETADRLVNVKGEGGLIWNQLKAFGEHLVFYTMTIFHYMAPWTFFLILVLPFMIFGKKEVSDRHSSMLLLGWVGSMLLFFSFIYFTIAHYMLIITTPLAILLAYGILELAQRNIWLDRLERGFAFFLSAVAFVVLSAYLLYIIGLPPVFAFIFVMLFIMMTAICFYKPNISKSMLILFCIMLIGKLHAPSFAQAGLTPHTKYRRFVERIREELHKDFVVGVGSHELHEKEVQVFLNRPVGKYANDHEGWTILNLGILFKNKETVYCLIRENDYNKYLREQYPDIRIIHTEKMFKKNIPLGKELTTALINFDREAIQDLLREDVLLVRRDAHE